MAAIRRRNVAHLARSLQSVRSGPHTFGTVEFEDIEADYRPVARAKELRPFVERLITVAKRGTASGVAVTALNARRQVMQDLQDREVVGKLFETIAPRFSGRAGGYTRLLRLGFRKGDAAEIGQVELVGSEFNPRAKAEA